jgi:hypothetical protein
MLKRACPVVVAQGMGYDCHRQSYPTHGALMGTEIRKIKNKLEKMKRERGKALTTVLMG